MRRSLCPATYLLLCICLLAGLCAGPAWGGGDRQPAILEGFLFSREGPVTDGVVRAYADYPSLVAHRWAATSRPGEKPGQYVMEIAPGRYYFTAKGTSNGRPLFSYHGMNPITIDQPYRWLPFFLVASDGVRYSRGFQGISGRVFYKSAPLNRGIASVYAVDDRQFRGMGLLTNTLDDEGRFFFDLEPGSYVVIARQRRQGSDMGPLHKGDLFCYPANNPVEVRPDTESGIDIRCYPRDDLADFLDNPDQDPRGRREPQRRHASYWRETMHQEKGAPTIKATGQTTLTGTVTDLAGRPRRDLYVSAYPADNFPLFQMHVLRLITPYMTRTDEKGRFSLQMPAGVYYLVAREQLGQAPEPGEQYGLYEGNANHSVVVDQGPRPLAITIVVEPIMP